MGKIFGISDLPVTIFTTPFKPIEIPKPIEVDLAVLGARKNFFNELGKDIFINHKYANLTKQTTRKILK